MILSLNTFTSPDIVIFEVVRLLCFTSLRLPLFNIVILMVNLLLLLLIPVWQINVDSDIRFPLVSIWCCLTGIMRISRKEKNRLQKILADIGPVLFIRPWFSLHSSLIIRENPLFLHSRCKTFLKTTFLTKPSCDQVNRAIVVKGTV